MSYRFPSGAFDAASLIDPLALQAMIQPAQEEINQLGEHNYDSASIASGKRSDACFYDFHTYSHDANPEITNAHNWRPVATNGTRIPDNGDWAVVSTTNWIGADDRIWVLAWAQYGVVDANTFSITDNPPDKARVQFALRVNGSVIDTTITGRIDKETTDFTASPAYPNKGAKATNASTDSFKANQINAQGFHVGGQMIQYTGDVPAGNTVIEFVVRRVFPTVGSDVYPGSNSVPAYTFSHRLVAVQVRDGIERTDAPASAAVPFPEPGDAYTSTTLTGVLSPMRVAINSLSSSNAVPEGIRYEHLGSGFSQVQDADQTALLAGSTTSRIYPGWGTDGTFGAGNWDEVNDGAGNPLRVSGPWDYATTPAFVLILGNVHFTKASGGAVEPERYGVFGIGQQFTGSADRLSESHTNNPNITTAVEHYDCDVDVPLLAFADYRTSSPGAGAVSLYRMLVTGNGDAAVTVEWQKSNLIVIHFYK